MGCVGMGACGREATLQETILSVTKDGPVTPVWVALKCASVVCVCECVCGTMPKFL